MIDYETGEIIEVTLHDGSNIILKKLDKDYDPTDRSNAIRMLEEANFKNWLVTGLIYIDTKQPCLFDIYNLVDKPLNRLSESKIRPPRETIEWVNSMMF